MDVAAQARCARRAVDAAWAMSSAVEVGTVAMILPESGERTSVVGPVALSRPLSRSRSGAVMAVRLVATASRA